MYFTRTAIALAATASTALAAVTADQVVANINTLSEMSNSANDIAKSISVTNFFSTAPQLINSYRQIIQLESNDVSAMNSKRSLEARQECLNVEDVQKCIEDLEEIIEDPSEILGDKRRRAAPATNYSAAQQEAICSAFHSFVVAHQQLLATTIGKHGLLSLTPFTQPIGQVLRVDEGGIDTLAYGIIDTVPTCQQSTTQDKNALDQSLAQAVDVYSS